MHKSPWNRRPKVNSLQKQKQRPEDPQHPAHIILFLILSLFVFTSAPNLKRHFPQKAKKHQNRTKHNKTNRNAKDKGPPPRERMPRPRWRGGPGGPAGSTGPAAQRGGAPATPAARAAPRIEKNCESGGRVLLFLPSGGGFPFGSAEKNWGLSWIELPFPNQPREKQGWYPFN